VGLDLDSVIFVNSSELCLDELVFITISLDCLLEWSKPFIDETFVSQASWKTYYEVMVILFIDNSDFKVIPE
jgi:hypothetical protein